MNPPRTLKARVAKERGRRGGRAGREEGRAGGGEGGEDDQILVCLFQTPVSRRPRQIICIVHIVCIYTHN